MENVHAAQKLKKALHYLWEKPLIAILMYLFTALPMWITFKIESPSDRLGLAVTP